MAVRTWRVVTHLHSRASNGAASGSHALVAAFVRHEFGANADQVDWFECATSNPVITDILDGRRTSRPVDLLLLTDHMSPSRHVVDEASLDLARRHPRLAIGAEIRTCLPDGSGGFVEAPEVLVYGSAERHESPAGGYYGLTQALIDEAFDTCTRPGAPAPDTHFLHAFCGRRRLACALAHPLDGHALPLPRLLEVIKSFRFVETLNGGYSPVHARLLERLLAELGRQRRVPPSGPPGATKTPDTDPEGTGFVALGGSDAHLNHFDRVVTLFSCEDGQPDAGTFIAAMLRAPSEPGAYAAFKPTGHGISAVRLHWEVLRLILMNLNRNRHLLPGWRQLLGVLCRGAVVAGRELRAKQRAARNRRRELADWLEASQSVTALTAPQPDWHAR